MNASHLEEEIKRLILNSAPERENELRELWDSYCPHFFQIADKEGFTFEAGPFGHVRFTRRTILQIWILGFAAQAAFLAYGQLLVSSLVYHEASLDGLQQVNADASDKLIEAVGELGTIENLSDFCWPSEVPDLHKARPNDTSGAFAFDLNSIALAYCFLHEIQHVKFNKAQGTIPCHQEELRCDQFARDFLLENVESYSKSFNYPLDTVRKKRAMGIGVASFFLLAITPFEGWAGTPSHPPLATRITALTDSLSLPEADNFWIHFSSLLVAQLRWRGVTITGITATSPKGVCLELVGRLPSQAV